MRTDLDPPTSAPAPPAPGAGARRRAAGGATVWLRRNWIPIAVVAAFCVLAVLAYGGDPFSNSTLPQCACGDEDQEVWFLAWPAYALAHGHNPFFSAMVAYPRGVDMMSSTSMPLVGMLLSPLSLAVGPVASYNLLARLALAASATSMTFVLRRYTRAWPAAFAGGLLYGFNPFFMAQGLSHLYLTFAPLPPIAFLLLDDLLVRQHRHPARTGVLLGLVAAAQLLISAEVLAMTGAFAAAGVVLLAARHPVAARERARHALAAAGAAVGTFVVLAAYPIWEYFAGPQHVAGRQHPASTYLVFRDDLLAPVLPTSLQWLGGRTLQAHGNMLTLGNAVDHAVYLGVPLLLVLVYLAVRFRRVGVIALSALLGLGALLLTFGARLTVDASPHVSWLRLPYDVVLHLPELKGILATRFAFGVYFFAAVVLGVGLDRLWRVGFGVRDRGTAPARAAAGGAGRAAACTAIAVVALLPLVPRVPIGSSPVPLPALFSTPALLDRIPAGSVVLAYPDAQLPTVTVASSADPRTMLWQAATGMRFTLIGAYAAQPNPAGGLGQGDQLLDAPIVVQRLFGLAQYGPSVVAPDPVTPQALAALPLFCRRYGVSTIVVDPSAGVDPQVAIDYVARALHAAPEHVGGVDVWFGVGTLARKAALQARTVERAPPTTVPATPPTTSAPAATTTTVAPGTLPQTTAFPSASSPGFAAEMQALWSAIVTGTPARAAVAFFPEPAYVQVKAIADPAADWQHRLWDLFALDVGAAHRWLGAGAAGARLLRVEVASSEATWIRPGYCYNGVGYWHAPGARIVYEEGGVTRSIGIASLISWRGVWYVVHLGAVLRSSDEGVVDDPATGAGALPPAGGC